MILDVFLNHNAKLRHPELAVGTYGYIGVFKGTFSLKKIQVSQVSPTRPERAEALSPGQRPGLSCSQTWRPVRAKALKTPGNIQSFCPYRAHC